MRYILIFLMLAASPSLADGNATEMGLLFNAEVCLKINENHKEHVPCYGLKPPTVVISSVVDAISKLKNELAGTTNFRMYGMYFKGEDVILISPSAPDIFSIIRHESVHYLLERSGIDIDKCQGEKLARKVCDESWYIDTAQYYGCNWEGLKPINVSRF